MKARARQGSVEIEVTQDLLANEAAFLEHFHSALAQARKDRGEERTAE